MNERCFWFYRLVISFNIDKSKYFSLSPLFIFAISKMNENESYKYIYYIITYTHTRPFFYVS